MGAYPTGIFIVKIVNKKVKAGGVKMKVLVVGSGGREHALTWKIAQSSQVDKIFAAPGNPGTAKEATNVDISGNEIEKLADFAEEEGVDLTFVGPEAPLVSGIVDLFRERGLKVFGPSCEAARLEGSKVFAKDLMKEAGIPTAEYQTFNQAEEAISYIKDKGAPIVVKADGLAAGKGVFVAKTKEEAIEAVETIMIEKEFGSAGEQVVVEDILTGEEATVLALTDGETIKPLIPSQDHKPAYDNDKGPNTGGMGAYAPAPIVTEEDLEQVQRQVLEPTLDTLKKRGIEYKGIIYCGLMISDKGEPRVLEYNVRFGDPEAQVVLPLLKTDLIEVAEAVLDGELEKISLEWLSKIAVCVVMASGGYPINYEKGKKITGIEKAKTNDRIVFQAGTKQKDNNLLTAGGRVLGVVAWGEDYQETIDKAYQGVGKIEFADAHYRTDIGDKVL